MEYVMLISGIAAGVILKTEYDEIMDVLRREKRWVAKNRNQPLKK